ncbi:hypothetical protein ACTA71_007364 [Dictyostelium dimigraforme]
MYHGDFGAFGEVVVANISKNLVVSSSKIIKPIYQHLQPKANILQIKLIPTNKNNSNSNNNDRLKENMASFIVVPQPITWAPFVLLLDIIGCGAIGALFRVAIGVARQFVISSSNTLSGSSIPNNSPIQVQAVYLVHQFQTTLLIPQTQTVRQAQTINQTSCLGSLTIKLG